MAAINPKPHFLFLTTSTRQTPEDGGHLGNTEWLARQAAAALPAGTAQTWHHLPCMQLPMFVDQRHTTGQCGLPAGDMKILLDATLAATDIVFVAPVYWYSIPAPRWKSRHKRSSRHGSQSSRQHCQLHGGPCRLLDATLSRPSGTAR